MTGICVSLMIAQGLTRLLDRGFHRRDVRKPVTAHHGDPGWAINRSPITTRAPMRTPSRRKPIVPIRASVPTKALRSDDRARADSGTSANDRQGPYATRRRQARRASSTTAEGMDAIGPALTRIHHRGQARHRVARARRNDGGIKAQPLPVCAIPDHGGALPAPLGQVVGIFRLHRQRQIASRGIGGLGQPVYLQINGAKGLLPQAPPQSAQLCRPSHSPDFGEWFIPERRRSETPALESAFHIFRVPLIDVAPELRAPLGLGERRCGR